MKPITDAYISIHGECPSRYREMARPLWHMNKAMFTSGWACALAWKEEQVDFCPECGEDLEYPKSHSGTYICRNCIEQDEMLEIEEDILYQQEELR